MFLYLRYPVNGHELPLSDAYNGMNAEVDFMIVQDAKVIPVEVKSGSSGTLRSLHSFIDESGIDYTLRLYSSQKSIEKNKTPKGRKPYTLVNLPLYYAGRLVRKIARKFN